MTASLCAAVLALQTPAVPPARCEALVRRLAEVSAARLERTVATLAGFGTRHALSAREDPKRGIGAARRYLLARLRAAAARSDGRMTVAAEPHEVRLRDGRTLRVVNVAARIRGRTRPDLWFVVGAHYDSRNADIRDAEGDAPGANDDGSGTAAVLELADILASWAPPASLELILFDGEELGLLGSRAEAKRLAEAGTRVLGMATLDIVGNTEAEDGRRERGYVRVFAYLEYGGESHRAGLDSPGLGLARAAADCARRYLAGFRAKLILRGDRFGRGGDHRPFAEAGFPAVRFSEALENFARQHQDVVRGPDGAHGDLPEFVDAEYLAQVTRLVLALTWEQLAAPPPPRLVLARGTRRLGTRVTIRAAADPGRAGWEVLWRATTAPDWQGRRFVPAGPAAFPLELPDVLLDDSIVGVRSVGRDGSRSRAVAAFERGLLRVRRR